jgi:hypothetical protein
MIAAAIASGGTQQPIAIAYKRHLDPRVHLERARTLLRELLPRISSLRRQTICA